MPDFLHLYRVGHYKLERSGISSSLCLAWGPRYCLIAACHLLSPYDPDILEILINSLGVSYKRCPSVCRVGSYNISVGELTTYSSRLFKSLKTLTVKNVHRQQIYFRGTLFRFEGLSSGHWSFLGVSRGLGVEGSGCRGVLVSRGQGVEGSGCQGYGGELQIPRCCKQSTETFN